MGRNIVVEMTRERKGKVSRLKSAGQKVVHVINPVSGSHRFYDSTRKAVDEIGGKIFVSERSGQITELVMEALAKDPSTHVVVYGGDGTVFEAVNGIMQSGCSDTAVLSVIPSGSGNDFSAYANDSGALPRGEIRKIDLVKTTCGGVVRYFDNMMNIGFDCDVVYETFNIRKAGIVKGSAAYIAGVTRVLASKKPMHASIELSGCIDIATGKPIGDYTREDDFLLTSCSNCQYCGGGFKSAPIAKIDDGYVDVLLAKDISRTRCLSLIRDYHAGTFIDKNGIMKKQFSGVLEYKRCKKMTVTGPARFCLDGELIETGGNTVEAEVVPQAINFMPI